MLLFGVLMVVQDTIHLFIEHLKFAQLDLCRDATLRESGGKYADIHCDEHEAIVRNAYSISTWLSLFANANYKIVAAISFAICFVRV